MKPGTALIPFHCGLCKHYVQHHLELLKKFSPLMENATESSRCLCNWRRGSAPTILEESENDANNNLTSPKSHLKTTGSERKAVAVGFASVRRTSSASAAAAAAAMAQCLKLNNASMLSLSDAAVLMTTHSHRKLDRSLSEPVERSSSAQQQQQQRGSQANSSRYKTELCRPFEENGTCKYGDKCQFAHGAHELRTLARHPKYKTELCRTFHTIGFCPYGPRCHFIHNADESRNRAIPGSGGGSRPKALSIGSFSLGSAGDSPPSSLSESPTSLGSFFDDAANFSSPSATPTANNAFSFGGAQDFTNLVPLSKQQAPVSNRVHSQFTINMLDLRNLNELDNVFRESTSVIPIQDKESTAPLSPVDSLGSELDNLSLSGSPTSMSALRLPIFSRLSTSED